MINKLLTVFLTLHFLADFVFQSEKTVHNKRFKYGYVLLHCIIYLLLSAAPLLFFEYESDLFWTSVIVGGSHFIVDTIKYFISNTKLVAEHDLTVFLVDQFIHLSVIVMCVEFVFKQKLTNLIPRVYLEKLFEDGDKILAWIATVVVIGKPVNVIYKKCFGYLRPEARNKSAEIEPQEAVSGENSEKTGSENTKRKAGATIGIIERILILFCLVYAQYACIGLVFTAKSIARYKNISENPSFAEYYLVGTLFSVLATIVVYWVFFGILAA